MLCFAAITIEKAEIFMPKHKSKMYKFFGTRRFPNLSNNQSAAPAYLCKNAGCVAGSSMHALIVCYTIRSHVRCPV